MTTLYGVNYTKYNTGPTEDNIGARGSVSGKLSYIRDTYEFDSTADGTVIYMGHPLNAGDRIQGFIFSSDDLGDATIDIGDGDSASRYAADVDTTSAASGSTAILVDGCDYVVGTADDDEIITLTVDTAAATGTAKLTILYSRV